VPALGTSLLELIRRTACDLPADVDHALENALKGEEPGTNGEAAIEMFLRAAIRARQEKIPLGGDPAALRFTVDAPPGFDRDTFRAAADAAAHSAAEEGLLRTDFVDLPGGRPRRGMQLGAPPAIVFRDVPAPAAGDGSTRVSLRIVSYFEAGATAMRTLPGPGAPGIPSLDGVVAVVLAAIHEQQGRPAGPGVVGVHIGADPVSGLAAAEAELRRPIDDRNPQRPLAQLESRIVERANQLGIGPLALGGRTTILGAKIAVDPAPVDRWAVSIALSSWALRRHTVTIGADGAIRTWESALTEEGAAKSAAKLAARFAARKAAEKAAEKAAKAAAAAAKPPPKAAPPKSTAKAPSKAPAKATSKSPAKAAKGLSESGSGAVRKEASGKPATSAVKSVAAPPAPPAKKPAPSAPAAAKPAPSPAAPAKVAAKIAAKSAPGSAGKGPAAPPAKPAPAKPQSPGAAKPPPPPQTKVPAKPPQNAGAKSAAKPATKPAPASSSSSSSSSSKSSKNAKTSKPSKKPEKRK